MSEAPSPQRVLAMDVMRGVAVFLMMEQHIGVWLWSSFASPSMVSACWSSLLK